MHGYWCECDTPHVHKSVLEEDYETARDWMEENNKPFSDYDVRYKKCHTINPDKIVFSVGEVVVIDAREENKLTGI